jgi:poly-gamma-glutamate capsule biosynthesis protein CapA/YwtB (metallophosphatase superfamily)
VSATRRNFLLLPALGLLPRAMQSCPVLPPALPVTRILFGGDVMLSRYVGIVARAKGDPGWPLHDVSVLLSSADIAFANLESPFSDRGRVVEKGMLFKAEPEMIQALLQAGISVVSTANNHARDCGGYGVEYTLDWLGRHGIAAVGTGSTAEEAHQGTVLGRNGVRFGFLA